MIRECWSLLTSFLIDESSWMASLSWAIFFSSSLISSFPRFFRLASIARRRLISSCRNSFIYSNWIAFSTWNSLNKASFGSSLIFGLFLMFLALNSAINSINSFPDKYRFAYRSVPRVSSKLYEAGPIQATITVFEFPPRESEWQNVNLKCSEWIPCNNRVNLLSLYGMWVLLPSTRAEITFPRADRERLIFVAS